MTEIDEALEWADLVTRMGPPLIGKVTQKYIRVLVREYRKLRDAQYNPSLDEALNSGDGSYKP